MNQSYKIILLPPTFDLSFGEGAATSLPPTTQNLQPQVGRGQQPSFRKNRFSKKTFFKKNGHVDVEFNPILLEPLWIMFQR